MRRQLWSRAAAHDAAARRVQATRRDAAARRRGARRGFAARGFAAQQRGGVQLLGARRGFAEQRGGVSQLLGAIKRTPWWRFKTRRGDEGFTTELEEKRHLFETLLGKGNKASPHLNKTHEATAAEDAPLLAGTQWVRPVDGPDAATICFIHGGGFFVGSPTAYRGAVASLCAEVPGGAAALVPKRVRRAAIPWRRVAATPRSRRENLVETGTRRPRRR